MHLKGKNLSEVSFPVGGIGAGCIGINGIGQLSDWEIFNHAGKYLTNLCSHFSARAERNGKVLDARIVNGPQTQFLSGRPADPQILYKDFGWGPDSETLCGFPHFRECELNGEFPAAEYSFSDPVFPGKIKMTAWSPFIPGESDLASMPCAMFDFEIENTTNKTTDYSLIGVLSSKWINPEKPGSSVIAENGLTQLVLKSQERKNSLEYGELALSTDAERVSWQEYLFRGVWCDTREVYSRDLFTPGPFRNRVYTTPEKKKPDSGLLAAHITLKPRERKTVHFILSWYIPNRSNDWADQNALKKQMKESGIKKNFWRNYYTKLCSSAADASRKIFAEYDRIRNDVFTFRKTLHDSSIPEAALQGAAENLAVLVSPTCLRVEDGTLWGWEGVGMVKGACPGTCQHVWNYAQALSLLFPDLERSIRESQFKYGLDKLGKLHFRLQLPLGIKAQPDWMRPCADGSLGEVMKTFREWKISGDTKWLKKLWPSVKTVIGYAWSPHNEDLWDPKKTGLISGRQHHTLDVELFGPSGWLEGHYLGALKAGAEMAEACGDSAFAKECRSIFERGRKAAEKVLFNGEYYIQKVDFTDKNVFKPFLRGDETVDNNYYWSSELKQLKYQYGEGCEIDSHLGQWYASLYGIGDVFDPKRIRTTLRSIYKYNFRKKMSDFVNTWRVFALNDEAGTVICTWPDESKKPMIPLPYNSETMTGFEWAAACHCIMIGERKIGETIAKAIRDRYNGANRNPWNEIECGSNYARAMAAYAMLQAYSGFQYDMTQKKIGFAPKIEGDFSCFWSLGTVWGNFSRTGKGIGIEIRHGNAEFEQFAIDASSIRLNGKKLNAKRKNGILHCKVRLKTGDSLLFE